MFDAKSLLDQIARGATSKDETGTRSAGGLDEILQRLGAGTAGGPDGGVTGTLADVLAQAAQGVKDGARDAGLTDLAREAVARVSGGQSTEDIVAKAKALVADNQLATGAVLGGLGGLLLGTRTGREIVGDAAKLGAAALIGGLAYKAYQNYKAGKPLVTARGPVPAAPHGSGFEPQAMSNETAVRLIRAMIAAAAADGRIDPRESEKILAAFHKSGANKEAEAFLGREIENPATAAALAEGVQSEKEALEIYAAARIAIDPDTEAERTFLTDLAARLKIAPALAAEIDTAARQSM